MVKRKLTSVLYLKPRAVSAVAYLPTLGGVRPVSFKLTRAEADRVLASAKVRKRWVVGERAYPEGALAGSAEGPQR